MLDTNLLIILGVVLAVLAIAIVYLLGGKKNKRGNALMIIGLSQSGKTCLFFKLKDGKLVQSHTSVKENYAKFTPKLLGNSEKEIEVIDIPGYSRVRQQLINQYLPITKKIVYVLDASEFDCAGNAE